VPTTHNRRLRLRSVVVGLLLAMAVQPLASAYAAPTNAAIDQTRAEADAARVQLDELAADLEERNEDYLETEDALAETRRKISITEADLDVARADLGTASAQLEARVRSIYRNGRVDLLSVLVGVTDFQDFVSRLDLMRRIGRSDAALVASVKDSKSRIDRSMASLQTRKVEQVALRAQAKRKRAEVQKALAAQERFIAGLDVKLTRLVAEERERQERLARERAARLAEEARRRAVSFPAGSGGRTFDAAALGAPRPDALAIAKRYVNLTPYVWGGTTPAGFDCSGLTQFSYAAVGVSIPRTSRQQFRIGAYIPPERLDLLQPGDLVFFGRGGDPSKIHHVGMYAGDGMFVHAPQTGERVSVSSLLGRISTRGDYVGACRP